MREEKTVYDPFPKDPAKMSERELRAEVVDMRFINAHQARRIREMMEELITYRVISYRDHPKTTRITNKAVEASREALERAAQCTHENLRTEEYPDGSMYHRCLDCQHRWTS